MAKTLSVTYFVFCLVFVGCVKPFCHCEPDSRIRLDVLIVNQQGQNMVFGLQASFRLNSIKILKTLNNFSVHHASVQRSYKDTSAVELNFYLPEAKSFIYYNPQTLPDSLEIRWAPKKGKCCGEPFTFYGIDEIKFNSTIVLPQNNIYILTK